MYVYFVILPSPSVQTKHPLHRLPSLQIENISVNERGREEAKKEIEREGEGEGRVRKREREKEREREKV